MKTKQLLIYALIVMAAATGGYWLGKSRVEKKRPDKPDERSGEAINSMKVSLRDFQLRPEVDGTTNKMIQQTIRFEYAGKLESGSIALKAGTHFRKNEVLCQLNNEEQFYELATLKTQLKEALQKALPEIANRFAQEKNKWQQFRQEIRTDNLMPFFPAFHSPEEKNLLTDAGITGLYYQCLKSEARIKKLLFIAPFDGIITSVRVKPGMNVSAQEIIAELSNPDIDQVSAELTLQQANAFIPNQKVQFLNQVNEVIGTGQVALLGKKSADTFLLTCTIKTKNKHPWRHDMGLRIRPEKMISEKLAVIPKKAAVNGFVEIRKNKRTVFTKIEIIQFNSDSLFVRGLSQGEQIWWRECP